MATLADMLDPYPPHADISASDIRAATEESGVPDPVFIVLDDDPTGTQSVADLPVLTSWESEDFEWAFKQEGRAIYVMTNSRSLGAQEAQRVTREVVANAYRMAQYLHIPVAFVSRSDSTLRGHFPLETDTITEVLRSEGVETDGIILVPAFPEAGRITIGGTHYVKVGDGYIPVGESQFARDATFGFRSSSLASWVEEKTGGTTRAENVLTPDLAEIRVDIAALIDTLNGMSNQQVIAPDIADEEDLRQLCLALIDSEASGKNFIYRVGPPFVRARIGQDVRPPVAAQELEDMRRASATSHKDSRDARPEVLGGLIVVGSHVDLTTSQLRDLHANLDLPSIEINVPLLMDDATREQHLADTVSQVCADLLNTSVVISTSRALVTGNDPDDSLAISRRVSEAIVDVTQGVIDRLIPRFVVAKGGITSSDVASKGLRIRHARCVGSMLPGIVSLWAAQDGPAQGIPYVVFPGNVGDVHSLTRVVTQLIGQ